MRAALTLDEARAIFAGEVDAAWLSAMRETPEGRALIDAALDVLVEADRQDAASAANLSYETAPRAARASANLLLRRTRTGEPLRVPGGTFVQSADGVRFVVDDDVTLPEGDTATFFDTTCTAEFAGDIGVFPAGTIEAFAPLLETLSGQGTKIDVVPDGGLFRVRLTTDVTQPHPFRQDMRGLYVQIVDDDGGHPSNIGRIMQVDVVNGGAGPEVPGATEDAAAWSRPFAAGHREVSGWDTDEYPFTWRVLQWFDLGIVVANPSSATIGTPPALEGLAILRGIEAGEFESRTELRRRMRLAPQGPTPLGLLRRVLEAAIAFGQDVTKFRIYEQGALEPDPTIDRYAANFPGWGGFLADIHVSDMDTPETPDIFTAEGPYGVSTPGAENPGLGLPFDGTERRVVVRWDEGAISEPTTHPIRLAILAAAEKARPPGVAVELYQSQQHGYPDP